MDYNCMYPMTAYQRNVTIEHRLTRAAQEAKAKRQVVLERVRARRAHVHKRTSVERIEDEASIRGSTSKERYQEA